MGWALVEKRNKKRNERRRERRRKRRIRWEKKRKLDFRFWICFRILSNCFLVFFLVILLSLLMVSLFFSDCFNCLNFLLDLSLFFDFKFFFYSILCLLIVFKFFPLILISNCF